MLLIRLLAIALFCTASLLASAGNATVATSGCASATSCSLDELFAGGSLTVDGILFSDWQLVSPDEGLGGISVLGLSGSGLGFDAAGLLAVSGPELLDFEFEYLASTLGAGLSEAGLALSEFEVAGSGFLFVDQYLYDGAASAPFGANVALADGTLGAVTSDPTAFGPLSPVRSATSIQLSAALLGDAASLTSFAQSWSQGVAIPTPEPGAPLLFALNGLLAAAALRRNRSPRRPAARRA